jgi:hypothetical protein
MNFSPIKINATSLQRFEETVIGVHYMAVVSSGNGIAHTRGMVDADNAVSELSKAQLDAYVISKLNVQYLEASLKAQIPGLVPDTATP